MCVLHHSCGCARPEALSCAPVLLLSARIHYHTLQCLPVIWPHPLSMSLLFAGYAGHNMPAEVPVEFLQFNSPEDAHPLIRNCLNAALKRAVVLATNMLAAGRKNVRRQLGLPPLSPPVLRSSKDGTSRGQLNSWKGPLAVQPPVPRAIYLAGVTWELVSVTVTPLSLNGLILINCLTESWCEGLIPSQTVATVMFGGSQHAVMRCMLCSIPCGAAPCDL